MLISASGELGPAADATVYRKRIARLRALGACAPSARLDAVGRRDAPAFENAPERDRHAAQRAARLERAAARRRAAAARLLAALDAFFRARRRRVPIAPWIGWLVVAAVPLPVAWLWLRVLAATGVVDAPAGLIDPRRWPAGTSGIVAVVSAIVVAALGAGSAPVRWRARSARGRSAEAAPDDRRGRGAPGVDGLAVATAMWLCGLVALAWVRNPYAAGSAGPRRAPVAVRRRRLARVEGGRRARGCGLLVPPCSRSCTSASRSNSARSSWRGAMAIAAMTGSGVGTMLLFAGLLAALAGRGAGAARAPPARARGRRPASSSRTRGPLSATPARARSAAPSRRCGDERARCTPPARVAPRAARALDGADRLRHAAARRRRRDARCGRSRCPRSTRTSSRASCPASSTGSSRCRRRRSSSARSSSSRTRSASWRSPRARWTAAPTTATPSGGCGSTGSALSQRRHRGHERRRPAQGPGPLPGTPLPGQRGTVGDRRAPHHLRRAVPQDRQGPARATRSIVTMPYGRFTYRVERTRIVKPTDVWVTQRVSLRSADPVGVPSAVLRSQANRRVCAARAVASRAAPRRELGRRPHRPLSARGR